MIGLTTEVTVMIHGTEMDLIADGDRISPAEPDVGIMRSYIDGWDLHFADGTPIPSILYAFITMREQSKISDALNDALARGDFDPEPDRLREDRDECRRVGWEIDENPFKPEESI